MERDVDHEQTDYANALGERIRKARGTKTREQLAHALQVHVNTIGKFERGITIPDAYALTKIAAYCGCETPWLLTGEAVGDGVAKSLQAVERGGYVYVPHFDIQASAGSGVFNDIETVKAMRPFDAAYIRGMLSISHNELALITVVGASMQPLLHSKDTVLLDLRACEVTAEGVHAIRIDGALLIKKVQRLPGRTLRIISANSSYESFDIVGSEEQDRDFSVIGRVRWGGVTFD